MTAVPAIEALLPVEPELALPAIAHRARDIGFGMMTEPGGLTVILSGGLLQVRAEGAATRLRVAAEDMAHLQGLRDWLTEECAAVGIVPEWRGSRPAGRPDNHALARVVASERISPSYRRVTVAGPELARFATGGLHFRLLFGPEGAGWPETDANGVTRWPGGAAAWHKPVYTTRLLEDRGGIPHLSFDVFLHEGGRTAGWCSDVVPGAAIMLSGPGGKGAGGTGWQGLVGDETAVPVIARLLALMPADARGQAVLVVPRAADIQPLEHPAGVAVRWALREEGATPLAALDMVQPPDRNRSIFFAAEAAEAQAARKALAGRGLDKAEVSAAAYWTRN